MKIEQGENLKDNWLIGKKDNLYIQETIIFKRLFRKIGISENIEKQLKFIEKNGEKVRQYTEKKLNNM